MIKLKVTYQLLISTMFIAFAAATAPALSDPMAPGYAAFERGHYSTAARAWRKLALQGNAEAENALATLYQDGLGVPRSVEEAIRLFESASGHGLTIAKHNLGLVYFEGKGVNIDYTRATVYFEEAAKLGLSESMYQLGVMALTGEGANKDASLARSYFKKAAQKDHPYAQLMAAHLLQTKQGGAPNLIYAHVWGSLAYAHGIEDALEITQYTGVAMSLQQASEAERLLKLCQEYLATCTD
ncbi:MAG: tetratricopeptide repeat protein [Halieaceae bacterium]|nr:tetratricopeptide repeat protein [Halieaceae bacterium]